MSETPRLGRSPQEPVGVIGGTGFYKLLDNADQLGSIHPTDRPATHQSSVRFPDVRSPSSHATAPITATRPTRSTTAQIYGRFIPYASGKYSLRAQSEACCPTFGPAHSSFPTSSSIAPKVAPKPSSTARNQTHLLRRPLLSDREGNLHLRCAPCRMGNGIRWNTRCHPRPPILHSRGVTVVRRPRLGRDRYDRSSRSCPRP